MSDPISLNINQTFNAPIDKVWQAWTDKDQLKEWFAPGNLSCSIESFDAVEGGNLRIVMISPEEEKEDHITNGVFKEVVPMKKLVFTWKWEMENSTETLVTVEFEDKGGSTNVNFTHTNFPNVEARDMHNEGWTGIFAKLSAKF